MIKFGKFIDLDKANKIMCFLLRFPPSTGSLLANILSTVFTLSMDTFACNVNDALAFGFVFNCRQVF